MLRSALIRIVYTGIMFLAGLVLSNLALPEGFGTISLLILNASLFSLITGLGADSLILHMVSNSKWTQEEASYFMWGTIAAQILLFLIGELTFLYIWHKTLLSGLEGWLYFFFDLLYFTGLIFTEKIAALLYSLKKARAVNSLLCILAFLYLLVLLADSSGLQMDLVTILFVVVLQSFIQGLVLLIYLGRQNSFRIKRLPKQQLVRVVRMSSLVMLTNVIQLFAYRVDFWFLAFYHSEYQVGLYAQATKFANLIWIIPNIVAQLLIPKFASLSKPDVPKLFSFGACLNLFIVLVTIVCADGFYFYYLDAAYQFGLSAFYIMLPGYFFWSGVIYWGAYFFWAGKFTYNLVGSSFCLILILIADYLLIPRSGLKGAAWANTITYTAVFFFYLFLVIRRFNFKWNELIQLRKSDINRLVKFVTS